MTKIVLILAALVSVSLAINLKVLQNQQTPGDAPRPGDAVIVKYDRNVDVKEYGYAVETSDGTKREERGGLLPSKSEKDKESLQVGGSYSYIGPDGVTYAVNYYADDTGFHAYGAHLPQAQQPVV